MLREFVDWLDSGERSPADLLKLCLDRIQAGDAELRAWTAVEPLPALGDGLLRAIPFGVQDTIDVAGLPVEWGSSLANGLRAGRDAAVVEELRHTGAVVLGKTATAAFGFEDPPATRNPRAPGRSPGGSASGSAAAVASGMAPFAIGLQTLGSVVCPASYCGICGFKPSFGLLPTLGALPLAPSFDTIGLFTRDVADMEALWSRGFGGSVSVALRRPAYLDLAVEPAMRSAFHAALDRLRAAGIKLTELEPPEGFDRLQQATWTIRDYEGARSHEALWRREGARLGPRLCAMIERGLAIPEDLYQEALSAVHVQRAAFGEVFWEYPLLLTAAATGPAPAGDGAASDPRLNAPWTALGMPALSIPMPVDGPPLGLQAIGAWGRDDAVISVAAQIETIFTGRKRIE
jgi:Asp-tRNA(Asn)/Glu-tRNA(Gln) amidotransferase A subunit family amidase